MADSAPTPREPTHPPFVMPSLSRDLGLAGERTGSLDTLGMTIDRESAPGMGRVGVAGVGSCRQASIPDLFRNGHQPSASNEDPPGPGNSFLARPPHVGEARHPPPRSSSRATSRDLGRSPAAAPEYLVIPSRPGDPRRQQRRTRFLGFARDDGRQWIREPRARPRSLDTLGMTNGRGGGCRASPAWAVVGSRDAASGGGRAAPHRKRVRWREPSSGSRAVPGSSNGTGPERVLRAGVPSNPSVPSAEGDSARLRMAG
jgi:hypothetical protein